jgi:hypothetical protein
MRDDYRRWERRPDDTGKAECIGPLASESLVDAMRRRERGTCDACRINPTYVPERRAWKVVGYNGEYRALCNDCAEAAELDRIARRIHGRR